MTFQELSSKIDVTEDGRVWSKLSNKWLSQHMRGQYKKITLYFPTGLKSFNIHRLVAEKFIPNPDNLPCVNHKDGNKFNNHKDNLEWTTYAGNSQHAVSVGLIIGAKGENNGQSKLTRDIISYCKSVYIPRDKQFGASALSRKFGVKQQTMSKALNNITWG